MRSINFEAIDWNESGNKEKIVKFVKTLLSLHSIRLVLISVCAITYLALPSTKTPETALSGKAIENSEVTRVNEGRKRVMLTPSDAPDVAIVTPRTTQRLEFPFRVETSVIDPTNK